MADMEHDGCQSTLIGALERVARLEHELCELRHFLITHVHSSTAPDTRPTLVPDVAPASVACPISRWEARMLGTFHLCCDGHVPPLCRSRRGQSILKYLLASPGYGAAAEALVDSFWPEADPTAAAHNLHMAVHALRRSLRGCGPGGGDETVLFVRDRYVLNPALTIVQDVQGFRAAHDRGHHAVRNGQIQEARRAFEQARALYTGDYLVDSPYDDWASSQRAVLQDMQLSVLSQLGTLCSQAGDWEQAAGCCQEVLAVDAYREDAYRLLMRCHAATGRLADVQRTYQACQETLRRDLRLDAAPETTLLYSTLTNQRVPLSVG
jgi:DNA-binding SARP family transcriptional activator